MTKDTIAFPPQVEVKYGIVLNLVEDANFPIQEGCPKREAREVPVTFRGGVMYFENPWAPGVDREEERDIIDN
ncbi:MAG TPA: hypothetical protein ENK08_02535 [Chloroflexi bacterium]|nr:hypothetical protein [Chloroflexota bacterium]